MHPGKSILAFAALLFAAPRLVAAQTVIPLINPSFELPHDDATFVKSSLGDYKPNALTGWSGTGNFGVYAPTTPFPGGVPDGAQVAYILSGSIFQDLSATLTAGTTYTLSGYVGQRTDYGASPGSLNLETTSGTLLAGSGPIFAASGAFRFTSVNFTPLATNPNLGQRLRIVLTLQSGGQTDFDLIRLTTPAAVPEPGSVALLVGIATVGATFARKRRNRS